MSDLTDRLRDTAYVDDQAACIEAADLIDAIDALCERTLVEDRTNPGRRSLAETIHRLIVEAR